MNPYRLKSIRIQGFQSYEDMTFVLGDVTAISGMSDSGKSAVVRALKAFITGGIKQSQVKHGLKEAIVTVTREDGKVIEARRSANKATFVVDGMELTKFGKATPPEVLEFLGWEPVQIDTTQVLTPAITSQHDGLMLLSAPAAQLAKALAKMAGNQVLHTAIVLGNKKEKQLARDVKIKEKIIDANQLALDGMIDVDEARRHVDLAKQSLSWMKEGQSLLELLVCLRDLQKNIEEKALQYQEVQRRIEAYDHVLQSVEPKIDEGVAVKSCIEASKRLRQIQKRTEEEERRYLAVEEQLIRFDSVLNRIVGLLNQLDACESSLALAISIRDIQIRDVSLVQETLKACEAVEVLVENLLPYQDIHRMDTQLAAKALEYEGVLRKLQAVQAELGAFDVCPFCEAPIDKEEHQHE